MAQRSNGSKLLYYLIGGVALLGVAWVATEPNDKTTTTGRPPIKHTMPAAAPDDTITPEDLTVKFDRVTAKPKNAFKPLVYHVNGGGGGVSVNDASAVPTEFTGGEADWGFTGTIQMDGANYANLDNPKSGEYTQLKRGDHWKKCTVSEVGADFVVMDGPMSSKKLLMPTVDTSTVAAKTNADAAATMPVMPQISGDIGGGAMATPADTSVVQGGGGGGGFGGRRGRRGRGGGGFGG